MKQKHVYIIAGPNGAGKTTFAKRFLPTYANCSNFVNADLIASGLAPFHPVSVAITAGKLVLQQIHDYARRGKDFAFETTLAGKRYKGLCESLKKRGYRLHLFFLWIPNPSLAIERIKDRVLHGGHDVPLRDVQRRFYRSIKNFFTIYEPIVDHWMLFDNAHETPRLIAKRANGNRMVIQEEAYRSLLNEIKK